MRWDERIGSTITIFMSLPIILPAHGPNRSGLTAAALTRRSSTGNGKKNMGPTDFDWFEYIGKKP